ncbi:MULTISPECIES: hypothetical protein [Nostocales]|uniref:Uncharacterized protein n=3 Tax=Nostocales TaxID=1161 RepID=A0A0C1QSY8_9CYAN|nr:hypothetical protein [Tolypothrix bouteillei]KAF3883847.1 hypothetical protein DA73_0400039760 [Tolypothrix bouteillei VB521301]
MSQYFRDDGIEEVSLSLETGDSIVNFASFVSAANDVVVRCPFRRTKKQLRKNRVKAKSKSWLQSTKESLRAEIKALKQEKAELESLLRMQLETGKSQIQEIQIEIDLDKLTDRVAEITQTESFQQLQAEGEYFRNFDC